MSSSSKVTYAQSSDIKARTYRQYRQDMNRKAIAELEFLPVLQKILAHKHSASDLSVKQNGCDAGQWFRKDGKITRDPDYLAEWNGKSMLYEFQYAEKIDNLQYFDFKVSKVGKKVKGKRSPHEDRLFFYVVKPGAKIAFISPKWIMQNGKEDAVSAWGNRIAYRVPRDAFMGILKQGGEDVSEVIQVIDDKNLLLSFSYKFYDLEAEELSRRLQEVIDSEKILKIMPRTLQGMYETCYILDSIDKKPDNAGLWLVYLLSFLKEDMSVRDMACLMFALDFLYSACGTLNDNEQDALVAALDKVCSFIGKQKVGENGLFSTDPMQKPLEETRQVLFCANMLENINQTRVKKLFQTVSVDVAKIAAGVRAVNESQNDSSELL